jgi:alpha-tubulin suppressor-like RCC1 family protein
MPKIRLLAVAVWSLIAAFGHLAHAATPLTGVTAVAAGHGHTCALTTGGGVKCWGYNEYGELGNGTTAAAVTPVNVTGLTAGVAAIAAGAHHTCALTSGGGVKCWGENSAGQLGNGTTTDARTPVDVTGLTAGVAAIVAGGGHTCALTTGGSVKCWGSNEWGQIGNGSWSEDGVVTPEDVTGLAAGVFAIAAGAYHTCALTTGGGAKCWGLNVNGQLGNGMRTDSELTPVDVTGLTAGVAAIVAGFGHTCALTTSGGVKCWGSNSSGQLGNGTTTDARTPVDATGLTAGAAAITAGDDHTCALTTNGGVKCWGANGFGQLGNGTMTNAWTPVDVAGLTAGVAATTAGALHTCALTTGGGAKCWGWNGSGQLGNGIPSKALTAVDVTGLTAGVVAIATVEEHTCALTGSSVKCWGHNGFGQLGNGTTTDALTPVDVTGLTTGVAAIATGRYHTCALTTGGGVKCWGRNGSGQLGNGTTTNALTPVDVTGLTAGVAAIAAGADHTCALTTGSGVKCWGHNLYGQLGDGTTTMAVTAVDVTGLTAGVAAITAGDYHTCALTAGGSAKCWGYNRLGQLGNGTTTASPIPIDVTGLAAGVAAIEAGNAHTCALTIGGGAKCWGFNGYGQLGNGTTTDALTAVDVTGLTAGAAAITAGALHTCALTTGGGAKCWGWNGSGQLGNGTTTDALTPVDVTGLTAGVAAIAAGHYHTCALTTGGGAKCWGDSYRGQLGNGFSAIFSTPQIVVTLTAPPAFGLYRKLSPSGAPYYRFLLDFNFDHVPDAKVPFGAAGDVPLVGKIAPGGMSSLIVFRNGIWYIDTDRNGTVDAVATLGGVAGDVPLVANFSGPGQLDDLVVYRAGFWFVDTDLDGRADRTYALGGLPGDIPVAGDVNGDGVADLAIYRGGIWYVDTSRDGIADLVLAFGGLPQDIPLLYDWDGDGQADLCLYRDGIWYISTKRDGVADVIFGYGAPGDLPLVGEF